MSLRASPRPQKFFLVAAVAAVSFGLFVILLGVNFRIINEISRITPHLESLQTQENALHEISESIFELQGARRGFILTGDVGFLASLDQAALAIEQRYTALRSRLETPGGQTTVVVAKLDQLQGMTEEYATQLRASVALRRNQPQAFGQQQLSTLQGEALSRLIQKRLQDLTADLSTEFHAESRALLSSTQKMQSGQALLAIAGVMLLMMAATIAAFEASKRLAAERGLALANTQLEKKVLERAAAQEAIATRYQRLVQLSADAIMLCSADGSVLYANPAAVTLVGHPQASDLIGSNFHSLIPADHASALDAALEGLWIAPHQYSFIDATVETGAGRRINVRLGAVSYFENDNLHVQFVLHDVTHLRANEIARLDQLHFIDQLFEAIPAPLSVRDERGIYLRINEAYEVMYQRSREGVLGKPVFELFSYDPASQISQIDHAAKRSRDTLNYDSQVKFNDGLERELLTSVRAFRRADDSVIGVISIDTDVTEIRRQKSELQQISAERAQLSMRLIHSQEEERRRVARDLHDQVGQILTALKMSLEILAAAEPGGIQKLDRSIELTDEALRHTRTLTSALHPHVLEDLGLEAALQWLSERYVQSAIDQVEMDIQLAPSRSKPSVELVAFRVVQEALTNVMRHAQATAVKVTIFANDGLLRLIVKDNGRGFDAGINKAGQTHSASLGLSSMRERIAEVGGRMSIHSAPDTGTSLEAEVPW